MPRLRATTAECLHWTAERSGIVASPGIRVPNSVNAINAVNSGIDPNYASGSTGSRMRPHYVYDSSKLFLSIAAFSSICDRHRSYCPASSVRRETLRWVHSDAIVGATNVAQTPRPSSEQCHPASVRVSPTGTGATADRSFRIRPQQRDKGAAPRNA